MIQNRFLAGINRSMKNEEGAEISPFSASADVNARTQQYWLLLLLLLGFWWRLVGLTIQSFWRDEVDVIWLSLRPLSEIFLMFTSPAQNGPLYYLLVRPWLLLLGTDQFSLRYISVLFGTIAIALMWQVARRMVPGDGKTILANLPFLSALFLAVNPYQIWYSQEGKMYSLVLALVLLSSWSWLQAMRFSGRGRWLRYLLVTSIAIYTHLMTVLVLPVHFVWFLLASPLHRQRWKGYGLTLSGFVLPYLPLIWWQWHYLTSIDYHSGYRFVPFQEMLRILFLNHIQGMLAPVSHLWLTPIFFLGLVGLLVGYTEFGRTRENNGPLLPVSQMAKAGMLAAWCILPVLLIYAISLVKPIFVDRYVIWIGPAFAMFLALGMQVARRNTGQLGSWAALGLVLFVLGFWGYRGWEQVRQVNKTQLREAIGYVAERRGPQELLILQIPHTHFAYRYFTSDFDNAPFDNSDARLEPWMNGLWTNNGLPDAEAEAQVEAEMRTAIQSFDSAWVILVEDSMWDSRGLMKHWLDEDATLVDVRQFHGLEVRQYQFLTTVEND